MLRLLKSALLILAVIAYGIAFLSAVCHNGETTEDARAAVFGFEALAFGWVMIVAGWPTWYANPLMLISIFLQARAEHGAALLTATIALVFASTVFLHYKPIHPEGLQASNFAEGRYVFVGAWYWLGAMMAVWVRSIIIWIQILKLGPNRTQLHPDDPPIRAQIDAARQS